MSLLTAVLGLWSADVGIDLGTANTLIHVRGRGIVLNEPSVVAVSKRTGQVLSVGTEARRMLGRTPADIVAMRPLRDGVIADFEHTEQMIRHFIARAHNRAWHISHPRVVIGIPSGVTEVEKRAVTDVATMAGAREAHLIEEPMAAAIGAGLRVQSAGGSMVVDIGGGTTEVAVISLGGVVAATSARVGGDEMDDAIVQYVRRNMGLLIGERTAEDIKIAMGSAFPMADETSFVVRGRDLITGLPKTVEMTTAHVREALSGAARRHHRARHGRLRRRGSARGTGQAPRPRNPHACAHRGGPAHLRRPRNWNRPRGARHVEPRAPAHTARASPAFLGRITCTEAPARVRRVAF